MKKDKFPVLDAKDLRCREAYDYYRYHRKKRVLAISQFEHFQKAVGGLMGALRNIILENEGGIYIKDWGYFCVLRTPVKTKNSKMEQQVAGLKGLIKRYKWEPYFFGEGTFRNWSMSDSFNKYLLKKIRIEANKGRKYKNYWTQVQQLNIANYNTRVAVNRDMRARQKLKNADTKPVHNGD